MANKLDPMDLKQIISLHLDGFSNRKIGTTLGISRNTINHYMQQFKSSELDLNALIEYQSAVNQHALKRNKNRITICTFVCGDPALHPL